MNARAHRFSWPNAFSLIVLLILGIVYYSKPADLDFCWQIRIGERILDSGRVNPPDGFSYTIHGKELPDHEWLYEVLLALVWRTRGDAGMKLLRVILFAAPLAILAWQLRRRGVRLHGIALTLLAGVLVFFYFERLRPLVCSTIGLMLVAGWLHDHCHGRQRLDWKLPVTMLLWGNLHPAIIMGQGLVAGAIAWEWLSYWRHRTDASIPRGLTLWGGLGLLATLAAPDPVGRLLYPFAPELRHPAQRLFAEIRPPSDFLGKAPHLVDFVMVLAIVFGLVLILRWRELRGWEWALIAGVTGLALTATRGLGDWLMITAGLAVPQIGPLLRQASRRHLLGRVGLKVDRMCKKLFHGPLLRPQPLWPAVYVAVLAVVTLFPIGPWLPNREADHWPTAAANWIEANGLPSPEPWHIFSDSDDGTYLLWRMPGKARVHSDTRGFYYPGDLLMDSFHLPNADEEWRQRLDRVIDRGTQYFLIRAKSKLWVRLKEHSSPPLYQDDKHVLLTTAQIQKAAQDGP